MFFCAVIIGGAGCLVFSHHGKRSGASPASGPVGGLLRSFLSSGSHSPAGQAETGIGAAADLVFLKWFSSLTNLLTVWIVWGD